MSEPDHAEPDKLAEAIGGLPEAEKLIATPVWFEGLSLEEAAERMETSAEAAAELQERATVRLAKSVPGVASSGQLNDWPRVAIDAECAKPWRRYDGALAERYTHYFNQHEDLRGKQRYSAENREAALPPGWGELSSFIDAKEWHPQHLSGKSSQTLAVGLLGVASRLDPSLGWLWEALSPYRLLNATFRESRSSKR